MLGTCKTMFLLLLNAWPGMRLAMGSASMLLKEEKKSGKLVEEDMSETRRIHLQALKLPNHPRRPPDDALGCGVM